MVKKDRPPEAGGRRGIDHKMNGSISKHPITQGPRRIPIMIHPARMPGSSLHWRLSISSSRRNSFIAEPPFISFILYSCIEIVNRKMVIPNAG